MNWKSIMVMVILMAATAWVHARPPALHDAALEACAQAVSTRTGAMRLDLVRRVEHAGRGNYEFWLNSEDNGVRSYCKTHRRSVADLRHFSGQWTRFNTRRPGDQALALAEIR